MYEIQYVILSTTKLERLINKSNSTLASSKNECNVQTQVGALYLFADDLTLRIFYNCKSGHEEFHSQTIPDGFIYPLSLLPSYLSPCLTFHNTLGQLPSPFLNPEPQVQMMEVGGTAANPKAKKQQQKAFFFFIESGVQIFTPAFIKTCHCFFRKNDKLALHSELHCHKETQVFKTGTQCRAGKRREVLPFHTMKTRPLQLITSCPVAYTVNHSLKQNCITFVFCQWRWGLFCKHVRGRGFWVVKVFFHSFYEPSEI